MTHSLRLREICSGIALGGKTLKEVGFPKEWEHNLLLRVWEKDGYDSECDGVKTREKYLITDKQLYEIRGNNEVANTDR